MRMTRRLVTDPAGFTLVELIIVLVVVGILAAVAIPRFTSVADAAQDSVLAGVGAAVASASATNYARRVGNTGGIAVPDCATAMTLAQIPAGVTGTGTLNTDGTAANCVFSTASPPGTATVAVIGAP